MAVERGGQLRQPERFIVTPKIEEHTCAACNGTGFPFVTQPVQPDRKIYPVKCDVCEGKGKVTDAN